MYIAPANTAAVSGQAIISTAFNTLETDIGTEITNSLDRNGRSSMLAALPMGSQKITGMADPAIATDAATKNYVDTSIATAVSTNISYPTPQGYLTLVSNTPVISADAISATTLFYTFKTGGWVVVHNGTTIIPLLMASQFQLTLTASQAASNIYDIFLAYNSNSPVIGTGPSWSAGSGGSIATGTCARGTGVGGTALTRLNGVTVNAAAISLIWNTGSGNTTITVPANQGIYLGSIFVDTVAGQVTCHRAWGQSRKWGVWNAYNRQNILLKGGDPTASWGFLTNTTRFANANSANSLIVFAGLPEEQFRTQYEMSYIVPPGGDGPSVSIQNSNGIGYNWVSGGASGRIATVRFTTDFGNTTNLFLSIEGIASFIAPPSLGINTVAALDQGSGSAAGFNYQGTESNMVLSAEWQG